MADELFEAAESKSWDKIKSIAEATPNPDGYTDLKGHTALHLSVMNGAPLDAIAVMLRNGADPNKKQAHGNTAVHLAVASQNAAAAEVLEMLFAHGADPNKRNNGEATPLHVAVASKAPAPIFQSLVAHGADPAKKVKGKTVIEAATISGLGPDVVRALGA